MLKPKTIQYPDFLTEGAPPCSEVDPDLFFPLDRDDPRFPPTTGGNYTIYPMGTVAPKALCHTCPYENDCLTWAMKHQEPGIWGGTTEGERRNLQRNKYRRRGITNAGR